MIRNHFTASVRCTTSGPAGMTHSELIVKQGAPLFPVASAGYFGRAMMWMTSVPTGGVHVNYVQSSGTLPDSTQVAKYGWGSMFGKILAGYTVRDTEPRRARDRLLPTRDLDVSDRRLGVRRVAIRRRHSRDAPVVRRHRSQRRRREQDWHAVRDRHASRRRLARPHLRYNLSLGWAQYQESGPTQPRCGSKRRSSRADARWLSEAVAAPSRREARGASAACRSVPTRRRAASGAGVGLSRIVARHAWHMRFAVLKGVMRHSGRFWVLLAGASVLGRSELCCLRWCR